MLGCRFAGPMERLQAEAELINRVNSTYLVRHRSREFTEYAISIKWVGFFSRLISDPGFLISAPRWSDTVLSRMEKKSCYNFFKDKKRHETYQMCVFIEWEKYLVCVCLQVQLSALIRFNFSDFTWQSCVCSTHQVPSAKYSIDPIMVPLRPSLWLTTVTKPRPM